MLPVCLVFLLYSRIIFCEKNGDLSSTADNVSEIEALKALMYEQSHRINEQDKRMEQLLHQQAKGKFAIEKLILNFEKERAKNQVLEAEIKRMNIENQHTHKVFDKQIECLDERISSAKYLINKTEKNDIGYNLDKTCQKHFPESDLVHENVTINQLNEISSKGTSLMGLHHILSGHSVATRAADGIAFSIQMSAHATGLGNHQTIPLDLVQVNVGNGFDPVTYTFICPARGVYFFHLSLMAAYQQHIEAEIMKDGTSIASVYAAGSTAGHGYDQGANAVVASCDRGEHVWVRVIHDYGTDVYSNDFTKFTGFLLFSI